jgi:hypothetical protein
MELIFPPKTLLYTVKIIIFSSSVTLAEAQQIQFQQINKQLII